MIYRIVGDLDAASAPLQPSAWRMLEVRRPREIVLDLHGVTMIDWAGLRIVVDAA